MKTHFERFKDIRSALGGKTPKGSETPNMVLLDIEKLIAAGKTIAKAKKPKAKKVTPTESV